MIGASGLEWTAFPLPFHRGELICGKYKIDALIGVGSSTFVVSAWRIDLNDEVALKFLRPGFLVDSGAVQRFADQACASVALQSDFIATVLDVEQLADGAPFIVMERVRGNDLRQELAERGRLSSTLVATYAVQVCAALSSAHALGIVHCGIRPTNLFLARQPERSDVIKVLDFGISSSGIDADALGSLPYSSPEQMRAKQDLDARTDIWSLGCVMYELLSGKLAFEAHSAIAVCAAVLEGEPIPLSSLVPDVSPELETIVMRCLEKEPQLRFQHVDDLARALLDTAQASGCPTVAHEPQTQEPFTGRAGSALSDAHVREENGHFALSANECAAVEPLKDPFEDAALFAQLPAPRAATSQRPAAASQPRAATEYAKDADSIPATSEQRPRYSIMLWLPLLAAGLTALAVTTRYVRTPVNPSPHVVLPSVPVSRLSPSSNAVASGAAATVAASDGVDAQRTADPRDPRRAPTLTAFPRSPSRDEENSPNSAALRNAARRGKPIRGRPTARALAAPELAGSKDLAATSTAQGASDEHANATSTLTQPQSSSTAIDPPSSAPEPEPARTVTAATDRSANIARAAPSSAAPFPGTIAPRAVAAVIRGHAAAVQDCFDRAQMDHPDLHGRVVFRATVDPLGHVTRAWTDNQLDNGGRLTACILAQARDWKFPPPAGGTSSSVSYTFVFD